MTPNKWRKWAALLWAACLFVTVIGPAIENRGAKIMAGLCRPGRLPCIPHRDLEILALPGMRRPAAAGPAFRPAGMPALRI